MQRLPHVPDRGQGGAPRARVALPAVGDRPRLRVVDQPDAPRPAQQGRRVGQVVGRFAAGSRRSPLDGVYQVEGRMPTDQQKLVDLHAGMLPPKASLVVAVARWRSGR